MSESPSSGTPRSPDANTPALAGQAGAEPQWTWLARIRRPQGRKGEVFADILTDFPEKFADRRRLWLLRENSTPNPAPAALKGVSSSLKDSVASQSPSQNEHVSGHDFSRAKNAAKNSRALAPAAHQSPLPREVSLSNHWLHKGGIILHFSTIDSINDAETLAGLIVAIPQTERAPLAEDETYIGDLIGCALVDVAQPTPQVIGEIEDVDRTAGPVALLVVSGPSGEILVPFAKSYLRKIDLPAKRVEMALPEGLVDLNAPEKP